MLTDEFKARLSELGLSQSLAASIMGVPLGTLKSWLNRGEVPDETVAKLVATASQPVAMGTETVAKVAPVTPDSGGDPPGPADGQEVIIPTAEKGHEEFSIMADGWARGFPSDEPYMRMYRTAHAIRRFAEMRAEEFRAKALTQDFWANHAGRLESRVAFFRKLGGAK